MDKERIAKAKDWVKRQHDSSAWLIVNAKEHDLSAKDIASAEESYRVTADLLVLLDECEKTRAGDTDGIPDDLTGEEAESIAANHYGKDYTPSPGLSDADERALETIHEAAYDGLCHKYRHNEKEWWQAVLDAETHLRSRLSTPAPLDVCDYCRKPALTMADDGKLYHDECITRLMKPAPPAGEEERHHLVRHLRAISIQAHEVAYSKATYPDDCPDCSAIRALILQPKATVTREWMYQRAGLLSTMNFMGAHPEEALRFLLDIIRDIGVVVTEGK